MENAMWFRTSKKLGLDHKSYTCCPHTATRCAPATRPCSGVTHRHGSAIRHHNHHRRSHAPIIWNFDSGRRKIPFPLGDTAISNGSAVAGVKVNGIRYSPSFQARIWRIYTHSTKITKISLRIYLRLDWPKRCWNLIGFNRNSSNLLAGFWKC